MVVVTTFVPHPLPSRLIAGKNVPVHTAYAGHGRYTDPRYVGILIQKLYRAFAQKKGTLHNGIPIANVYVKLLVRRVCRLKSAKTGKYACRIN